MKEFFDAINNSRGFHLFAVGLHAVGVIFFAWAYSKVPSNLFVFFAGWCCVYGASSLVWLRKEKAK
ncbi:hypothetical protein LF41_2408 [Lysobacter dokdonensis DS-58]|uniref:Transmembrane protein n=1 Tax=Lysobacter dokdonensis DS-58 TaxID=1300345 RepID=A0A0A2WI85_9GAMM|nr:hypothetical protein [Lysobacter dokdonensis]KGQ19901.1 hypothetical protein LF41_2408 [Lysobacter dokdonensis DS-58]